ncbi:unnamed protein product [Amaranthus hypochondriacus]
MPENRGGWLLEEEGKEGCYQFRVSVVDGDKGRSQSSGLWEFSSIILFKRIVPATDDVSNFGRSCMADDVSNDIINSSKV